MEARLLMVGYVGQFVSSHCLLVPVAYYIENLLEKFSLFCSVMFQAFEVQVHICLIFMTQSMFSKATHIEQACHDRKQTKVISNPVVQHIVQSLILIAVYDSLSPGLFFSVLSEQCACHGLWVTAPLTLLELVDWSYELDKAKAKTLQAHTSCWHCKAFSLQHLDFIHCNVMDRKDWLNCCCCFFFFFCWGTLSWWRDFFCTNDLKGK